MLYYSSVCEIEFCVRSVKIDIFDIPKCDKITFSLGYRTLLCDTTCGKLHFGHAFLFKRARKRTSRTECENSYFRQVRKSDFILVGTFAPERSEGEKATRCYKSTFSLVYLSNTVFVYDVYEAWFSACFFIRACAKCPLYARSVKKYMFDTRENRKNLLH